MNDLLMPPPGAVRLAIVGFQFVALVALTLAVGATRRWRASRRERGAAWPPLANPFVLNRRFAKENP
jgi:hypothetical protein